MMDSRVIGKIRDHFAQYRTRHYKKGQILIYDGDEVEHIYHLTTGTVKQYAISYKGDELVLNLFKPPAFFPMGHAINRTPAKYMFEAETDIEVRQAPAAATVEFVRTNPDVLYDLLSRTFAGTEGLLGRMEQLMTGSAASRLTYELIVEARRFGRQDDDKSCVIKVNESDLAARTGLSRETVNRVIHKLKADELITVNRGSIRIPDLPALETSLGRNL